MITRTLLTLFFFYNKKRFLTQSNPLEEAVSCRYPCRHEKKHGHADTGHDNILRLEKFLDCGNLLLLFLK